MKVTIRTLVKERTRNLRNVPHVVDPVTSTTIAGTNPDEITNILGRTMEGVKITTKGASQPSQKNK